MHCIICIRKVSSGNIEDDGGGEIPAAKSVVEAPGFLTTFNEIWGILEKSRKNDIASGIDAEITLTTLIDLSKTTTETEVPFTEAPTMCERCCDKVVSVENLMKAVRHQVREIGMLFEQFRRRRERVGGSSDQQECIQGQSDDREFDDSVEKQIKQDDWCWQELGPSTASNGVNSESFLVSVPISHGSSQVLTSFISEASDNETPMECDDDEDDDETKSEDPDYIKSEEENDDDDSEEINSSSEEEEEQELVIPVMNTAAGDPHSTPPDPLANSSLSTFSNKSIQSSEQSPVSTPKLSRWDPKGNTAKLASKQNKGPFVCNVEGCRREIKTKKGLLFHMQKLHCIKDKPLYPCNVPGCTKSFTNPKYIKRHKKDCHPPDVTLVKQEEEGTSSTSNLYICGLEGCSRVLDNEVGLLNHKTRCHPKLMTVEMEKDKKEDGKGFPCSCGKTFSKRGARYRHILKNKEQHPEYKLNPRKNGTGQKCDICNEGVAFSEMFDHLNGHLNGFTDYVIKCPNVKCRNLYTNSKGLGAHISNSKTPCGKIALERKTGMICETCGFTTTERLSLRNHVENHELVGSSEKVWGCPITGCGKVFGVKQSMYFHLTSHRVEPHSKITYQKCDKCGDKIKIVDIEEHLKDKHGILEVMGCKQCAFKFSERDELAEHLYEHRHVGIICDICGEGEDKPKYFRYVHFREHYLSVHQLCPKKYKCEEEGCKNTGYWRKDAKDEHYNSRHKATLKKATTRRLNETKKELICELCLNEPPLKFVYELELTNHKIRVHGEDPFNCESCGEKFNDRAKFLRHQKEMHGGIKFKKEWKCEVEGCDAPKTLFSSKRQLNRHMKIYHEEGKKFVCDVCGKAFENKHVLAIHNESVHLKLKRAVCEECGEGFTSANVLKRHKLIHTGERPFGCDICGQRFRHREVLKRHVIGHEEKGADFKPNGPMKQIRKRKAE